MARKFWIVLWSCSLVGISVGLWLSGSSRDSGTALFGVSVAVGIFAFVKSIPVAAREPPAPRPVRGASYRDVVFLRSLALGFAVASGLVFVVGPYVMDDASLWLLLAVPGGGAASFWLTSWLQTRGRDEHGDQRVPPARVRV